MTTPRAVIRENIWHQSHSWFYESFLAIRKWMFVKMTRHKFPQQWRMWGGGDMTGKHDPALSSRIRKTRTKCRVAPSSPATPPTDKFEYETSTTRIELLVFHHWVSCNMRTHRKLKSSECEELTQNIGSGCNSTLKQNDHLNCKFGLTFYAGLCIF